MKSRKNYKTYNISELVLFGIAATILIVGGLMHAIAKNREVELAREVDKAKKRIEQHQEGVAMYQVKIDRSLDRYLMKDQLRSQGSELRETAPDQYEYVKPNVNGDTLVNSNN